MNNFYFSDFTTDEYRKLLRRAKDEYQFITFEELDAPGRVVLWRHDVDLSIHRSLRLAQIESEENVMSTYFVHLHSPFYHWGEKSVVEKLRSVMSLGHKLGLHFDPAYYAGRFESKDELCQWLAWEKQQLEMEFDQEITVFSFHNPDVGGDWLALEDDLMAGMINTYGRTLRERFTYCSDSNGYWRYERLREVLDSAKAERLHILTHPGWWQSVAMPPKQRIVRCINGRAEYVLKTYEEELTRGGRLNVD